MGPTSASCSLCHVRKCLEEVVCDLGVGWETESYLFIRRACCGSWLGFTHVYY